MGERTGPDDPAAACTSYDPELWFAEHGAVLDRAKAVCATCPLRAGCLAGALDRREPWGVWGGEIFQRGRVVEVKRGRGRPRRSDPSARGGDLAGPDGLRTAC